MGSNKKWKNYKKHKSSDTFWRPKDKTQKCSKSQDKWDIGCILNLFKIPRAMTLFGKVITKKEGNEPNAQDKWDFVKKTTTKKANFSR